ncbi:MAG: hypothetical protein DMG10_04185 [Acidobacteria bacterium]|nr:MAG: hypothetical protein DMG10_04185 [Acidobacteriota bacterium]
MPPCVVHLWIISAVGLVRQAAVSQLFELAKTVAAGALVIARPPRPRALEVATKPKGLLHEVTARYST